MENKRHFEPGTKVRHFKFYRLSLEDRQEHRYEYEVIGDAIETETGAAVVVYKELAPSHRIFVRPADSFYSKVDKFKYPDSIQEYRLEKIEED